MATALLVGAQAGQTAPPRPASDTGARLEVVGQAGGLMSAVAVADHRALVAVGPRLAVVDVAVPSRPRAVGGMDLGDVANDVAWGDGVAYVAAGRQGLQVLTIDEAGDPMHVVGVPVDGVVRRVVVSGDSGLLLVETGGRDAALVLDVTTPTRPRLGPELDLFSDEVLALHVHGGRALVSDGGVARLFRLNASAPARETAVVQTEGVVSDVALADDKAYAIESAATGWSLHVLTIDAADHIAAEGSLVLPGRHWGLLPAGDTLLLLEALGIRAVAVTDPGAPEMVGLVPTHAPPVDAALSGDLVLAVTEASSFLALRARGPAGEAMVGRVDFSGSPTDVVVADHLVFTAEGAYGTGLRVFALTTEGGPTVVGHAHTPGQAWRLDVNSGMAFVADWTMGLRVLDVSRPAAPVEVGFLQTAGPVWDVVVRDGLAYVAAAGAGVRVIGVERMPVLTEVASLESAGRSALQLELEGELLVIAGWDTIDLATVAVPTRPTIVGSFDGTAPIGGVHLVRDVLFVADGLGLRALDVSDPRMIVELSRFPVEGGARDVRVAAGIAYLSTGEVVMALDASSVVDAGPMVELARTVALPGLPSEVAAAGDSVLVACYEGGLAALRYVAATTPPDRGRTAFLPTGFRPRR